MLVYRRPSKTHTSNLTTLSANGDYGKNIENYKSTEGSFKVASARTSSIHDDHKKHQSSDRPTHFVASAAPGIEENVCNSLCN